MKRHAKSLINLLKHHFGAYRYIAGAEVGVWRGELSRELLVHLPRLTLWMVDPWEKLDGCPTMKQWDQVIEAREEAERTTSTLRRVICQMTSLEASKWAKRQFQFVFIDADHRYESVRDDIIAWHLLVTPNGIICGHDYNGIMDKRGRWGVKRAVDERYGSRVNRLPGNVWWVQKEM